MSKRILLGLAMVAGTTAPILSEERAADVEALFKTTFGEACMLDEDATPAAYFPSESWSLTWETEYSDTGYSGTLHQFFCFAGAYNVSFVYYFDDPFDGPLPVAFAVPQYRVKYENEETGEVVKSISVYGFTTQQILTNAEFDLARNEISNNARSRGLGDASHGGTWIFENGVFVLKNFDVDASYDGEINPERVVEFK